MILVVISPVSGILAATLRFVILTKINPKLYFSLKTLFLPQGRNAVISGPVLIDINETAINDQCENPDCTMTFANDYLFVDFFYLFPLFSILFLFFRAEMHMEIPFWTTFALLMVQFKTIFLSFLQLA